MKGRQSEGAARSLLTLAALLAIAVLAGCSTTQPVGEQISDAEITARVKAKLAADPDINPFNIDVDTNEGTVTLQGRVESDANRAEAERLARETSGVKNVVNLLKVGDEQEVTASSEG